MPFLNDSAKTDAIIGADPKLQSSGLPEIVAFFGYPDPTPQIQRSRSVVLPNLHAVARGTSVDDR